MSYNTRVYFRQGGDELVVAAGGRITVETGGTIGGISLAAIPTTDPQDGVTIWNDAGVLKVASAGG
ncbi:hypothetical protein SAMN02927924_03031 [Sphingobium faniae]|nr:hypothetical protein SAMN02927924_03031 [Sphingobium faniae]